MEAGCQKKYCKVLNYLDSFQKKKNDTEDMLVFHSTIWM